MEITILTPCNGVSQTKTFNIESNGGLSTTTYQRAKYWDTKIISVRNIKLLAALLLELRYKPCIIIRGTPVDGLPKKHVERNCQNFKDMGSTFLMIDVDGAKTSSKRANTHLNTVKSFIKNNLPKCFHDVSCIIQYSCSAGVIDPQTGDEIKPGLCCHLIYELDTPITNTQAKALLRGCNVDMSLYTPVQPHYIMSPIIASSIKCIIGERIKLTTGKRGTVKLPPILDSVACNPPYVPSRSNESATDQNDNSDFSPPSCGFPSRVDMLRCDFMRWFVTAPPVPSQRYNHAFAYATNAIRTDSDPAQFVHDSLNENITGGYVHAEKLLASVPNTKPCSCRYIIEHGYNCKNYNDVTETCSRSYHPVSSPYALAIRAKLGDSI